MNRSAQAKPRADALAVLANLMDEHASLNAESRGRMDLGIAEFKAGAAPVLITTGWAYRPDCKTPISLAQRDYAIAHGVPEAAIIAEPHARDTVGDAVFIKRNILLPKGFKSLLVVTTDYHADRTKAIFSFILGPGFDVTVLGAKSDKGDSLASAEQQSLKVFGSSFAGIKAGDDAAILQRLGERHPFYNGEIHPQINID